MKLKQPVTKSPYKISVTVFHYPFLQEACPDHVHTSCKESNTWIQLSPHLGYRADEMPFGIYCIGSTVGNPVYRVHKVNRMLHFVCSMLLELKSK